MAKLSDTDLEVILAAWERRDPVALAVVSARFGVQLTVPALEQVDRQLGRVMTRKAVLIAMHQAREREIVVSELEIGYPGTKDVCLAVRAGTQVFVEVRHAPDRRTRVGELWEVQPWHRELARNLPALATWIAATERRVAFDVIGGHAPEHAQRRGLLDEIIAHPADDGPRLVFADDLMDRDDAHGELIRLQCEAATSIGARFGELWPRVEAILRDHGTRIAGDVAEHALEYRFHRGFVEQVTMTGG
ncbi:MAG: TIGR02996 domain-containing protein, partial [Deltaproteobacteria bacterium]|nr:TIGR02996 domain-containing protein [Deltaproteobacteria bacterium]